jgi:hypothetical protein
MTAEELVISVRLASDTPEGERFLGDLCNMLVAIAAKSNITLEFRVGHIKGTREARAYLSAEAPVIATNVGIHRAQLAPIQVSLGPLKTINATVEITRSKPSPASNPPNLPLLRTYNYPLGVVFTHATGERSALADVPLEGPSQGMLVEKTRSLSRLQLKAGTSARHGGFRAAVTRRRESLPRGVRSGLRQ